MSVTTHDVTPLPRTTPSEHKMPLGSFLARNPFPAPLTIGFYFREKMRAIHRAAPDVAMERVLELGGGQSGLTALLYPRATVVNLDLDARYAAHPCNQQSRVRFLCADATRIPFADDSFDAVTMFDVIEHIPDDAGAMAEVFRVLRPGGVVLISTPNERWRFPYYAVMKPLCPSEEQMFAEWGHVRRGYSTSQLERLIGLPCEARSTFISPITVLCHDVAFSRLPYLVRRALCAALSPITWLGYALHSSNGPGTENVMRWRKPERRL